MRKCLLIICLLAGLRAAAQTCTGGLGDPILDITFGQGTADAGPLPAAVTNLIYQGTPCPSDGYYTIASSTTACFGGTWFQVLQDHTGNPNGNMMIINASYQPSIFYTQTVNGLCGNTSYQFAAWVLNLDNTPGQIESNITFSILKTDGTVLNSYTTGPIPEALTQATWEQFAFYFNTPPGVNTVVLQMTNNAPGGLGNDLCLDDITFRPAGSAISNVVEGYPTDTLNLCINAQPTLSIDATVESCYASESVQWQESTDTGNTWTNIPGETNDDITRTATAAGLYLYRLVAAQTGNLGITTCEVESQPVEVDVIPIPDPGISIALANDTSCAGQPITIEATPIDGGSTPFYQWMVNGSEVSSGTGATAQSYTSSSLNTGDIVSAELTSDAACMIGSPYATSNPITIAITPIPVTGVSVAASKTQVCADSMVVFTATPVNGGADPSYQWKVNGVSAGTDSAVFDDGGLHNGDSVNCVMTADLACALPVQDPQGVTMTIYSLPVIQLDTATIIAGGSSIQLNPVVTGDLGSFGWTPVTGMEDPTSMTPVVKPVSTTAYTLSVVTQEGCTASATEVVKVFYAVKLPLAFTPNGDGHNDVFRVPPGIPVTILQMAVFNRQGERVFYTNNVSQGWDGTFNGHPQPMGTYVWFVQYNDPLTKSVAETQGTVILIR
jgi:gliding motility-associated-like protein